MTIDFDEKARENVRAAARLLPEEVGDGVDEAAPFEGLPNAAASRAYYAAYLAIAHRAQHRGLPFTSTSGKEYYRHDSLPDDAARWGIIDDARVGGAHPPARQAHQGRLLGRSR